MSTCTELERQDCASERSPEPPRTERLPERRQSPGPASVDRLIANTLATPQADGSARPNLELTEPAIDFGRVPVGTSRSTTLSIINNEPHAVELAEVMVVGSRAIRAALVGGNRVDPGDYAVLQVDIAANQAGPASAQIHIVTASGAAVMLPVEAVAEAHAKDEMKRDRRELPGFEQIQPLRWAWPTTLELEAEVGHHRDASVQIINDDGVPRTLETVAVTGTTALRVERVETAAIPPRSSASIVVRFAPTAVTQEHGMLVATPDRGPKATLPIIGRGVPRAAVPAPRTPSQPKQVEPPRSPYGALLSPAPEVVDFGEQVHGSHETRRVGAPFNLTQQPAVATFTVEGSSFKLLSARTLTLLPSGHMEMANWEKSSPLIEYAPVATKNTGALITTVVWGDGTREVQRIPLAGRARFKDEAPSRERSAEEIAEEHAATERFEKERAAEQRRIEEDQRRAPSYPQNAKNDLSDAYSAAWNAAGTLASMQGLGVRMVHDEAREYSKKVKLPEPSIWVTVLEIGLNMATAGIAAQVAKGLLPSLVGRLGGGGESRKFAEFTTEIIKDGIKRAGKAAVKEALAEASTRPESADSEPSDDASSANPRIEFFTRQEEAHVKQEAKNKELIDERRKALRPLLRTRPAVAASVMQGLAEQFTHQSKFAMGEQARISRVMWTTNVAKRELGTESVKTGSGKDAGTASRLDDTRRIARRQMPVPRDGLLDIVLERRHGLPKVASARMTGVSAAIVKKLVDTPLQGFPMPVRFVLGARDAAPTVVTRDEAGRVRVSGDLLYFVKYSSSSLDVRAAEKSEQIGPRRRDSFQTPEAEAIAGATYVVEQILSRPLAGWGITRIEHDDENRQNDPGEQQ